MEVHIYEPKELLSPRRVLTLMPVDGEFVACVNRYLSLGYIVVLCTHGRTGCGAYVDSLFNQLSGWNFSEINRLPDRPRSLRLSMPECDSASSATA